MGTVTDPSGQVVVGAKVTLISEKTGDVRNASTNDVGSFNFVAVQLIYFLVSQRYLLQAPPGSQAISRSLPASADLPNFVQGPGYALTSGFIIAVLLALAVAGLLKRSRYGFDLRVLGLNEQSADTFGIRRNGVLITSLLVSGATAGLAGGVLLSISPGGSPRRPRGITAGTDCSWRW